jgi:hypothetical protein
MSLRFFFIQLFRSLGYNQGRKLNGNVVSERKPLHERSFWGYVVAGLLVGLVVAFIGAVVFTPLGNRINRGFNPPPGTGSSNPTPEVKTTPKQGQPSPIHNDERADPRKEDPRKEQLAVRYDSFSSRFSAVEASLQQRARDLGSLPVKPEVTASLQTTRADLAEAKSALSHGDLDRAALRLKRVEETLKYLESL